MTITISTANNVCGAQVTGIDLSTALSPEIIAELRAHWLRHKILIFPEQKLSNADLERFSLYFGDFGHDPFFAPIDGSKHIAAIQRKAEEKTAIFAETFHSDWSFLAIPPAGTMLYSLVIPPMGGNTLFADQELAYQALPNDLKDKVDNLMAIHYAARGYAPDGAYGDKDQATGRSMRIISNETAFKECQHPLVRTHSETGKKSLFSSIAYIKSIVGMSDEESEKLLMELYVHQTQQAFIYSHQWQKDMLVMWDNRSLLHAATGGYDGYDRLLHRTTIADTQF